ncbi:hypothetical protein OAG1_40290 [Agarivorans sp. OAG1]|uniref:hypothetical protein n=1 Tax=Agarivorans sp. OAG1 TaxID=3082387 RepID=UPI002B298EE1|nr:hypothetical protein OAG1_40290 [Agarivorans sp. OAG1]
MKKILFALLSLSLLLVLVVLIAFALMVSKQATVLTPPSVSARQVADAKDWLKQNLQLFRGGQQSVDIQLSQQQLDGLLALSSTAFSGLDAEAAFAESELRLRGSITLPTSIYQGYVNSEISLHSSNQGLQFGQWKIGQLSLPGSMAQHIALRLAERLFPELQADELLASIKAVDVSQLQVQFKVEPVEDLGLKVAGAYKNLNQLKDPQLASLPVAIYYQKLSQLRKQYGEQQAISLYDYLYPLSFDVAMRGEQSDVLQEQQALVWATAIFFSQGTFQKVMAQRFADDLTLEAAPNNVTLAGRRDLLLHFVYSAGLSMAAEQGFSASIGEFKELFDSLEGGSGFSFADLAADRTGIEFAESAKNLDKAEQFLAAMRSARSEQAFFPRIDDLAEGISEQSFAQVYGSTGSELYQQKVFFIDQRIAHLPAFLNPEH